MDAFFKYLIFLLLGVIFITKFRVASETERYVESVAGRFKKLKGPGLLFCLSGSETKRTKLSIGNIVTYRGDGFAESKGVVFPVEYTGAEIGDALKVTSFRDNRVWASKTDKKIVICEKCGHENTVGT